MKSEFISAYVAMYGSTKKQAEKIYNTANKDYISAIIYAWKRNAKESFEND